MFPLIAVEALSILFPALVWQANGRAEAERDIANGTMKWKVYGHMAGLTDTDELARAQLRKRFGIELEAVAQCIVTHEQMERTEGYNNRIHEEVERRHGAGAIARVWEEAFRNSRSIIVVKSPSPWMGVGIAIVFTAGGLWASRRVQKCGRK